MANTSLLTLNAIDTSVNSSGSYTDVIAGFHSPAGNSLGFAAKYTDGTNAWYKEIGINGTSPYIGLAFNDLHNYTLAGYIYTSNKTSSLVAKLNQTSGMLECWNAFDPGPYYSSKLNAITYNSYVDLMIAVGGGDVYGEPNVQLGGSYVYGTIALIDANNCTINQVYTSKNPSMFNDVVVFNDPLSQLYGFTAIVGYVLNVSAEEMYPHILLVNPSGITSASLVFPVGSSTTAYATSVDVVGDSLIVGGTFKTVNNL